MAENKNTVRQADNEVVIEGILQEVRLDVKETKETKEQFITGDIDIEVGEGSVHTVSVFSKALKKDGTENGIFKGLNTVKDEYLSVAKVGKEEADKVRITSGELGINDYVGGDGQLKSYPEQTTNFINRIGSNEEFEPKAEFEVELFVHTVNDEVKNNEETGRVIVKGIVPLYGGRVAPLEFVAAGEGADYIRDNYEPGHTVRLFGEIVNHVEVKKTEKEVGFGKPKEVVKRKFTREYLITGGSEPYEEDDANNFSVDSIQKAMAEREVYLEGLLAKKKASNDQPKKEDKKPGFGGKPAADKKAKKDTLPF